MSEDREKKKLKPNPMKELGKFLYDHPLQKLSRGEAEWDDDYVVAMAEGRKPAAKPEWNKILKPVDPNVTKKVNDHEIRTYSKAIERAMCPKYHTSAHPFKLFDDATWCSDGEDVKHYNIKCQGTDDSPCTFCSDKDKVTKVTSLSYTPSPSPPSPSPVKREETIGFVKAKGYRKEDFEGEEETPKKISADSCKWCHWDPCVLLTDEVNEEAEVLVDNLIAQEKQGVELTFKNYRFALYRFYARKLGYKEKRYILPVCVQAYIDKHFVEKGEIRTGFKEK